MNPKFDDIVPKIKALEGALKRVGIRHLAIFGPLVSDGNTSSGDLDMVVQIDPTAKVSLFELEEAQIILEDKLGLIIDLVDERSLLWRGNGEPLRHRLAVF